MSKIINIIRQVVFHSVLWCFLLNVGQAQAYRKNYINKSNAQEFSIEVLENTKTKGSYVHLNSRYDRVYVQGVLYLDNKKVLKYYEVSLNDPIFGCDGKYRAVAEHTFGGTPELYDKKYLFLHPGNFGGYGHPVSYRLEPNGTGDVDGYRNHIFDFLCSDRIPEGSLNNKINQVNPDPQVLRERINQINASFAPLDKAIEGFLSSAAAKDPVRKTQGIMWYANQRAKVIEDNCPDCFAVQNLLKDAKDIFRDARDACVKKAVDAKQCVAVAP